MADKSVNLNKTAYTNAHNVKCKFTLNTSLLDAYSIVEAINNTYVLTNLLYPVGSIIYCAVDINPNTLYGGTWSRFAQGRTIEGVGTSTAAGTSGGEYKHMLTEAEMAAHTHRLRCAKNMYSGSRSTEYGGGSTNSAASCGTISGYTGPLAHNNVQPYEVYNIWRRTA